MVGCVFVEGVEFEPMEGGNLHFVFVTGDERLRFAMSRETVMQAAYSAMANVERADMAELEAEVVPLRR